ncbi:hypothetical protein C7M84_018805 [Penaeus vannamei]|uniref:Uncharacterized protein n=1 Tax=Penaeus vannamei TaxID=6689 RepID=A0A423SGF7_PENVA|nr:hypothetical protein C7M84_018805 [Penaeus vannamei]
MRVNVYECELLIPTPAPTRPRTRRPPSRPARSRPKPRRAAPSRRKPQEAAAEAPGSPAALPQPVTRSPSFFLLPLSLLPPCPSLPLFSLLSPSPPPAPPSPFSLSSSYPSLLLLISSSYPSSPPSPLPPPSSPSPFLPPFPSSPFPLLPFPSSLSSPFPSLPPPLSSPLFPSSLPSLLPLSPLPPSLLPLLSFVTKPNPDTSVAIGEVFSSRFKEEGHEGGAEGSDQGRQKGQDGFVVVLTATNTRSPSGLLPRTQGQLYGLRGEQVKKGKRGKTGNADKRQQQADENRQASLKLAFGIDAEGLPGRTTASWWTRSSGGAWQHEGPSSQDSAPEYGQGHRDHDRQSLWQVGSLRSGEDAGGRRREAAEEALKQVKALRAPAVDHGKQKHQPGRSKHCHGTPLFQQTKAEKKAQAEEKKRAKLAQRRGGARPASLEAQKEKAVAN